jgi:hypothetical protein
MSYDQDKVTRRVDAVEGVRRLSGVPDEGDDPLVKATAVWDGLGSRVEVIHGGPIRMSGPHPPRAHADEVEIEDLPRGPLVGPGGTVRDDQGRESSVPRFLPRWLGGEADRVDGGGVSLPQPSHEPDNTLEATGETCGECSGLMRRTGACMTCEACGTNTGCG